MANTLESFIETLKKKHGTCHLLYIISAKNGEEDTSFLLNLLEPFSSNNVRVAIHLFLKNKDCKPDALFPFIRELEQRLAPFRPFIYIASLSGDYYNHHETVISDAIMTGDAPRFPSAENALISSYNDRVYDNFMTPRVIANFRGVHENDGFYFADFSPLAAGELTDILKLNKDTRLILTT